MRKNSIKTLTLFLLVCVLSGLKTESHAQNTLVIALLPEKNIYAQRRHYNEFADYLGHKLNMVVHLELLRSYEEVVGEFAEGKIDAAFLGSFPYIQCRMMAGVEALARPVRADGSSTYCGYIFTRKDSGINGCKDMRGKKIALVKSTTAAYVFPLGYMSGCGVTDIAGYFSELIFSENHEYACWSVYIKEADVGAAKNRIFDSLSNKYPKFKDSMRILAKSADVPDNTLSVRKNLDAGLKSKLKEALLDIGKTREGKRALISLGAVKFIETSDKDYQPLYDMLKKLNMAEFVFTKER